ncbi:terminal uridylyltransferase Tailor-like [Plodia interpunctella]|uniref:terminal uridylyltransferase Tailor-like n=1 Tax=Plodia interpunctella TaxID=58824 RepID=UPI0023680469|nr:terminal uridylyltransferase Tailor-like [Plodia interpunctella]
MEIMAKDIVDVCDLNLDGDFEWQVVNIMESVRLTRSEVEHLEKLFSDLEQTLREYWPGCIVMPFGSIVTGLGIKTSDADCYVYLPEYLKSPGECYVMTAKHVLKRKPRIFQQLFAITAARVPILKFFHVPTQCECDVNFNSLSGVRNSKLIAYLIHMDKRALQFAILIKYWSKVHKLTGTNLVPNYALIMMAIFYLQQFNILPAVSVLQQDIDPEIVDNWDTSYNETYRHRTNNNQQLYSLLGGFFEYYSTYQYKDNIICPYTGYSINRNLFKSLNLVPIDFKLYKDNLVGHKCKMLQINSPMCVQDAFEHSRNTTMAVHPKLFHRFLFHLKHAADRFKQCGKSDFLQAILDPRNGPQMPLYINPKPQTRNVPNRPNRVTKQKNRNNMRNFNLHAAYTETNRMRQNARRHRF